MATEVATAYISLTASTSRIPGDVRSTLWQVESDTVRSSSRMGVSLGRAFTAASTAIVGVGAAIGGIALKGGFSRALAIEDARAKLAGLKLSTQDIEQVSNNALASVKGTAFGLGDAMGLAGTMVASGIKPGQELQTTLTRIADSATVAGMGLGEMGSIWGKAAAKGRIDGQMVNQLLYAQIPVYDILAKKMGVNADAVADMVSRGKVDFATFSDAMDEYLGGAAQKSGETFRGSLANITAALGRLGEKVAVPVLASLKDIFNAAIPAVDNLTATIEPFVTQMSDRLAPAVKNVTDNILDLVGKVDFSKVTSGASDLLGVILPLGGAMLAVSSGSLASALGPLGALVPTISGPMGLLAGAVAAVIALSPELRDSLGGAVGALASAFDGLKEPLSKVVPAVSDLARGIGSFLGGALAGATPALQTMASIAGTVLGGAVSALASLLSSVVAPALTAVGSWMSEHQGIVSTLAVAIGAAAVAYGTWIAATKIWQAVTKAAAAVQAAFNLVMNANPVMLIVTAVAALVAGLVYFFTQTETGKKVWAAFTDALGKAWEWLKGVAEKVWPGIQAAVDAVVSWWQTNVNPVIEAFGELASAVFERVGMVVSWLWTNVFQPTIDLIIGYWQFLWTAVQAAWDVVGPPLIAAIQAAWEIASGILEGIWNGIQIVFETVWNVMQTIVETILGVIQGVISTVTSLIKGDWDGVWNDIKGIFDTVWNGISGIATTTVNAVKKTISNTLDTIKSTWGTAWDTVKGKVSEIWDGIKSAVTTAIDEVKGKIDEIKGKVTGVFSDAATWLVDSGKNIIQGLIDGMNKMMKPAKDAIGGIANTVKGAWPFSPAKWGPFSGSGWYNLPKSGEKIIGQVLRGIEGSIPDAARTMDAAASALVPDVPVRRYLSDLTSSLGTVGAPSSSAAPGGGGRNVQVTNYITSTDPDGAAVAVARRLSMAGV
ncbi:MAG: tape measure protein [Micrococcales bacterium]|nr:tape measure protein [Micrococcales bacterium]